VARSGVTGSCPDGLLFRGQARLFGVKDLILSGDMSTLLSGDVSTLLSGDMSSLLSGNVSTSLSDSNVSFS
jgi:hypothetical protein